MPSSWTHLEVEATVADYFAMLNCEVRGVPYNKTTHRRALLERLNERSEGAIERKHQNISAVLIELGFLYINGYKPLSNYQQLLMEVVVDRLREERTLSMEVVAQAQAEVVVPTVEDILAAMKQRPVPTSQHHQKAAWQINDRPALSIGIDYAAIESNNRSLGLAGEEFVVRFEQARLLHAGQSRLAGQVEHVAKTQGDGLGFDVLSYDVTGQERLIEVKTTGAGASTPFYVTRNELAVSRQKGEHYHLYRAYSFRSLPQLYQCKGALDAVFNLNPSQYRAHII